MKSYDKAAWHIDAGEDKNSVISRFTDVFSFLEAKNMLNDEGMETLEYGMDSSVSLNSNMVTDDGEKFLDAYYDVVLKQDLNEFRNNLEKSYKEFTAEK